MEREVLRPDSGIITAAHELKAPLSLLRQLALTLETNQPKQKTKQISERMVATSEKALRQVNDLVKISRLSDAMFELQPVNPRRVCDETVRELSGLFAHSKRQIIPSYHNRTHLVVGNRELLKSVVYNFSINALNYSQQDYPSQIFIRDIRGGTVRIGVRDYGPAIPTKIWREIKNGIINRPLQIAMRPGSSGLGLYIAAQFCEHMRGKLGLIRHRDGTSFYIDLNASAQMSWL